MFKLLRLEDRIVLDGAALTDLLDEMHSQEVQEQQMADADAQADDAPDTTDDIGIDTDAMLFLDDAAQDDSGIHVLVLSSDVTDGDTLAAAAKDNVIVVKYDPAKTTLEDLSAMIKDALDGEQADSIAFASHYTGAGIMSLSGSEAMSADSLESNADQQAFWKSIGELVDADGRIDLLACDVAGKDGGGEFVSQIENLSGVNVAASADATGNEAYGGDWVLETDNVDVQATYFAADRLAEFDELLGATPPVVNADVVDRVYEYNDAQTNWNSVFFKVTPGYTDADDTVPVLPAGEYAFTDTDPDDQPYTSPSGQLKYSATSNASWLKFSTSGWYFYGNPGTNIPSTGGTVTVTLTATDTSGNTALQDFQIIFQNSDTSLPNATLAVTPATLYEDASPNQSTVTVNLSTAAPAGGVTVYLGYSGTVVSTDYSMGSNILTIASGATSASTTLTIASDLVAEGTETLIIAISSIAGANESGGNQQQTVTIIDNDVTGVPTVTLGMSPTSVTEGNASTITAYLSSDAPAGGVTVSLGYTGTYENGDFTAATSIVIAAGTTSKSITFQSNQDSPEDVDNEAVTVSMTGAVGANLGATTSVNATIIDNDLPPTVALSLSSSTFAENAGTTNLVATLSQAAGTDGATVYLSFGGTAVATDYTKSANAIYIGSGATSGFITLTGTSDAVVEGNETLIIDVASASGATEATAQQVTATILDDDAVTVSLGASSLSFAEEGGTTVITATLNQTTANQVQVYLGFTGTAVGTDYTASLGIITIAGGTTSGFITLTGATDTVIEGPETLTVSISNIVGSASMGTPTSVTTTILDNDTSTVTLGMSAATVAENGGIAVVTAYLDQPAGAGGVTVDLGFAGTALTTDYGVTGDPIFIAAGATTGSATITATSDMLVEGAETVDVTIAGITGPATAGAVSVTTTIVDDDAVSVSLGISNTSIAENGGTSTITAYLNKAASETVSVVLTYAGGATSPADYSAANIITIPAGSTTGSVTITATSDMVVEGDETIIVTATPVNASLGTPLSVTANITDDDDDVNTVTLGLTGSPFAENGGTALVTATMSQISVNPVTVDLGFSGTAFLGTDYTTTANATFIVIPAGSTSAVLTLTGKNDTIPEFDENVVIDITAVSGGATEATAQQVTGVITDDDVPIATIAISKTDIAETGGTALVTVTLDKQAGAGGVIVPLVISGDVTSADYFFTPTTLTIPAGSTTGIYTVYASSDVLYEGNEKMVISLGTLSGASKGSPDFVDATIVDDDAMPTVTLGIDTASVNEGATAVVTAYLSKTSTVDTTVDLSLAGTATLVSDYAVTATRIVIAAGQTTGTVSIGALTDAAVEGTETVTVDISAVANASEATAQQVTLSIADATSLPNVSLGISSSAFLEDGGTAVITATMDNTSFAPVTVDLNFDGTGTFSTDYTVDKTFIVIPAGSTSAFITLTGKDDSITEVEENITVTMSTVTGASAVALTSVSASIMDDETTPYVTLSLSKATFAENAGATLVVATLTQSTFQDVTVNLSYAGTVSAADYTAAAASGTISSLVIPAGSTTAAVTLTGVDDPDNEADETVVVTMGTVTGASAGATTVVTASLIDDDAQPGVTLTLINGASFVEDTGAATVVATLSAMTMETVTIELDLAGTAAIGTDYTASATVITIAPGATTGSISLTSETDAIDENDETAVVSIGTVSGASEMTAQSVTATLTDNDAAPMVYLSKVGSDPFEGGPVPVDIILTQVSGLPVTVELGFTGTAGYGTDYSAAQTTVVIPAGLTSTNVVMTTVNDTLYEGDENFTVSLETVSNADISAAADAVTVTIIDDDNIPTVNLTATSATFIEGSGTGTVTATLSAPSALTTTIDLVFTGTANATDYNKSGNQIVIPAGQTTGAVNMTGVDDAVFEGNETVIVQLGTLSAGITAGTSTSATAVLVDNDSVSVSLGISTGTIAENTETATVTTYLSSASENDVTVNLSFTGKATLDGDYTMATSITIPKGSTSAGVTLTPVNDTVYEGSEGLAIDVVNLTVGGLNMAATVTGTHPVTATINDDGDLPQASVSFATGTFAEAAGTDNVVVTLDSTSLQPVTVTLQFTGGTAGASDYSGALTSVTVPAGETKVEFMLTGAQDLIYEGPESLMVNIVTVAGGTIGTASAVSTIIDDDGAPTVTLGVNPLTIAEGGATSAVTAYLDHISATDITVTLVYTGGTAGASDYAGSTTLVISAGQTTGAVTLSAVEDTLYEGAENFTVDVQTVAGGSDGTGAAVSVTITDNDSAPSVTLSPALSTFMEDGGTSVITATLSSVSALPVTVTLAYSGTAAATDFTGATTLVISAGSTTGTVMLTGTPGSSYEGNETVLVDIASVENGTESAAQQVTVVIDDSADYPKVTLSVSPNAMAENGTGSMAVIATLSQPTLETVSVNVSFAGTANASDYTASGTVITISPNTTSGAVYIDPIGDSDYEGSETVIANITGVTGATLGTITTATATITEDDSKPNISLTASPATFFENGGSTLVTATLSAKTNTDTIITLAYTGSTAQLNTDFVPYGPTITITAGSLSGTVQISGNGDDVFENDESIVIGASTVAGNATMTTGTAKSVTATIVDDDAVPSVTLAFSGTAQAENVSTPIPLTVYLSQPAVGNVNVTLSYTGGTAGSADLSPAATGTTVVIPSGQTTATINLSTSNDVIYEGTESLVVSITGVSGNAVAGTIAFDDFTITDDDSMPTVTLGAGVSVTEGNSTSVTAYLSGVTGQPVTVTVALAGTGTNVAETTDYAPVGTTTIVIAAGKTTGSFTLSTVNDTVYEGAENVEVSITSVAWPATAGGASQTATYIIADNETMPTVSISLSKTGTIPEQFGSTSVVATLSGASELPVTVDLLFTTGGTAETADYTYSTTQGSSIVIASGKTTEALVISSVSDTLYELEESVVVQVQSITGAAGATGAATAKTFSIVDDDSLNMPKVTLGVNPTEMTEGGSSTVTVYLSSAVDMPVTVNLNFSGTAETTGISDYQASATYIVITGGSLTGTITLAGIDDAAATVYEGTETVIVSLGSLTNAVASTASTTATACIVDEGDKPVVSLRVQSGFSTYINEDGGFTKVEAYMGWKSDLPVTVDLAQAFSGTPAGGGSDYTLSPTYIVIPAGSTSANIMMQGVSDVTDDDNESVIFTLSTITNATATAAPDNALTVTLNDNDSVPKVTLGLSSGSFAENGGTTVLTATLNHVTDADVTVAVDFTGAAGLGTDYFIYGGGTSVITIAEGNTTGAITLRGTNDFVYEGDEGFVASVTAVSANATTGTPFAVTATVVDDEIMPTVNLSWLGGVSATEEEGASLTVVATLSAKTENPVTVNLNYAGTATGTDFAVAPATQIVIGAGSTTGSVQIDPLDESLYEGDESVLVSIASLGGTATTGATTALTGTILDADDYPTVTLDIAPTSFSEVGETALVTVYLSNTSTMPVTVDLGFSGTAIINSDYAASGSSLVIDAGSLTNTVSLQSGDDALLEGTETVIVSIGTVSGAGLGTTSSATADLTDNDWVAPGVTLSLSNGTFSENGGAAGGTTMVIATLDYVSDQTVTVEVSYGGTATTGDYTGGVTGIVISAGNTTGGITLAGALDTGYEGPESVIVDILSVTNASEVTPQTVTATLEDFGSVIPSVTLGLSKATFIENGGTTLVVATLSEAAGTNVTVNLGFSGTAVMSGVTDYAASATYIVITAGNTTGSVELTGSNDTPAVYEGTETVDVSITSAVNATLGAVTSKTAVIDDSEDIPSVTLGQFTSQFDEIGGYNELTVYLSNESLFPVTVDLAFSGTATFGTDYTVDATRVVIAAGSTQGSLIIVSAEDDLTSEGDETVEVSIGTLTGATLGATVSQTSSIIDDEGTPSVSLSILNGCMAEASGVSTVVATLSGTVATDVTISLDVTGTAGLGTDYQGDGFTGALITIPAGQTTGTYKYTALQDNIYEGDEPFEISVSDTSDNLTAGAVMPVTATIIEDDPLPQVNLSLSKVTFTELATGNTTVVTVSLSKASAVDTTVDLVFSGTAVYGSGSPSDYVSSATQVVIAANTTTNSVTLTAWEDSPVSLYEGPESVIVSLGSITSGTAGTASPSVTATIMDEDDFPVVTLGSTSSLAGGCFNENLGTASVTAYLSNASLFPVTVTLGYSGAADVGTDYMVNPGTVIVIPAGGTSGTINLVGQSDTLSEGEETVLIDIVTVAGGTESATAADTIETLNIVDDPTDAPKVSLSMSSLTFMEDGGTAELIVSLDKATYQDVTVDLIFTAADALQGTDYQVAATKVVIPEGQTTYSVILTGVSDDVYEDDGINYGQERFQIGLSATGANFDMGPQLLAVIDDSADLPSVTLSVSAGSMAEKGGTAVVTATLSKPVEADVVEVYLAFSGTAVQGTDYTYGIINIEGYATPGATTGTATLAGIDNDSNYEFEESVIVDIASFGSGMMGLLGNVATEGTPNQVAFSITDEEDKPQVALSYTSVTFVENGGTTQLVAKLVHQDDGTTPIISVLPTTVSIDFGGDATFGSDYTATANTIVISAGQNAGTISLTGVADSDYEGNESVVATVSSVQNATYTAPLSVTATLEEASALPLVTLSLSSPTFGENAGETKVVATLNAPSYQTVTVDLAFTGTAGASDYTAGATQIVITAGATTGSVVLKGSDDGVYEGTETVVVDISATTNAEEDGTQTVTASLVDDEPEPSVSLRLSSYTLAENSGASNAIVSLDLPSANPVVVTLVYDSTGTPAAVNDGKAETGDYTAVTTITINPGEMSASAVISTVDDSVYEGTETFMVSIDSVTGGTENGVQEKTAVITDDELMNLYISDVSVTEGTTGTNTSATLTIGTTGGSALQSEYAVSVDWAATDSIPAGTGTASAGTDYQVASGTVTLGTATLAPQTVQVVINGDAVSEFDEVFEVRLSNATVGTIADDTGVVTIVNDDNDAPRSDGAWITKAEGSVMGTIGTFTVTDDKAVTDVSAILMTPYDTMFTVSAPDASGTVTVAVNGTLTLDYENQDFYVLDVLIFDAEGAESTIQVVIEVTDVADAGFVVDPIPERTVTSTGFVALDVKPYFQSDLAPVSYTITNLPTWMTFTNGKLVAYGTDAAAAGVTSGTSFVLNLEAVFEHWNGTTGTATTTFTVNYIAALDFDPLLEAVKYLDGGEEYLLPEDGEAVDVNEVMIARSEAPVYDDAALYGEPAAEADPELAEIVALLDQEIIIDPETAVA
ncbi:MAG: Calx-beta domain-containing protein [Desulfococcaceae bacterium]